MNVVSAEDAPVRDRVNTKFPSVRVVREIASTLMPQHAYVRKFAAAMVCVGLTIGITACSHGTPKASNETPDAESVNSPAEQALTKQAETAAANQVGRQAAIELHPDRFGEIALGTDAETALSQLKELLGEPVADSGWGPEPSPCEGMGTRSRNVEWLGIDVSFVTGPTLFVQSNKDHFASFSVVQEAPNASRFLLSDRQSPFGRTVTELQKWNAKVERFDSEIAGRIWSVGSGDRQLSGDLDDQDRATSVRAGLFCVD